MNKEEKAVVGINLRLVDAETGEVIETAEARGESSRKSKDYAGVLGVKGGGRGRRQRHDQLELPADDHRRGDVERGHQDRRVSREPDPAASGQAAADRGPRRAA